MPWGFLLAGSVMLLSQPVVIAFAWFGAWSQGHWAPADSGGMHAVMSIVIFPFCIIYFAPFLVIVLRTMQGRYDLTFNRQTGMLSVPVHATVSQPKPVSYHQTESLSNCTTILLEKKCKVPEFNIIGSENQLFLVLSSGGRIPIVGYNTNRLFSFIDEDAAEQVAIWLNKILGLPYLPELAER
jgi:hypothetical protein